MPATAIEGLRADRAACFGSSWHEACCKVQLGLASAVP